MKVRVFVDGLNLYHGAIKGTPYKWLDIPAMCALLLPGDDIDLVRYYTAPVSSRLTDADAPSRQQAYLRALVASCPNLQVVKGHIHRYESELPRVVGRHGERWVRVHRAEEKGSDVNLAVDLVTDAFDGSFEAAVVVSTDSDLLGAVRRVRQRFERPVGLLFPERNLPASFVQEFDFVKAVRKGVLAASQLPDPVLAGGRTIRKPRSW